MPRVYSHAACIMCRRRRKKCDEERPICRTCKRLKLSCVYSTESLESSKSGLPDSALGSPLVIETFVSLGPESQYIGDFHPLPVSNKQRKEVLGLCVRLTNTLMMDVWPFKVQNDQLIKVRDQWLGPTMTSGAQRCLSVAALAAGLESKGDLTSPWQLVRARYAAEALSLMQQSLEAISATPGNIPDFTTLACAAHLPISSISYNAPRAEFANLAAGVRNLLKRIGGFEALLATNSHHLLQTIVRAEWISCLITSQASPYLSDFKLAEPSDLLADANSLVLPPKLTRLCDPLLAEATKGVKLLVHYRVTKEHTNKCPSMQDFFYLTSLLNQVDLQITHLQAVHQNTQTLSECITYTLILLRVEVLGHRWLHPRLGDLMCKRYFKAVSKTETTLWVKESAFEVLVWVLCVGAVLCHDTKMQQICTYKLAAALNHVLPRQGCDTLSETQKEVEKVLWSIAWHSCLSSSLSEVLTTCATPSPKPALSF